MTEQRCARAQAEPGSIFEFCERPSVDSEYCDCARRDPLRCHRIKVSGLTTVRASRQSKTLARWASAKRIELVALRGFFCRSAYRASCLRRNRFSAASAEEDRKVNRKDVRTSTKTSTAMRIKGKRLGKLDIGDSIA